MHTTDRQPPMTTSTFTSASPTDTASLIDRLTQFDGPPEQFLQELVATQCRVGRANGGAILKLTETGPQVLAVYPPTVQQQAPPVWLATAGEIAREAMPETAVTQKVQHSPSHEATHLVVLPIKGDAGTGDAASGVRGLTAFHINTADPRIAELAKHQLELTSPLLALYELRLSLQQSETDLQVFAWAMQTLEAVNRSDRFRQSSMALCNEVAATWRATRVCVGFVSGRYVKLRAMSQTEDLSRKMQVVQDIESAMEECLDQDTEVLYPEPEQSTTINRLGRSLSEKHGPTTVCTMPMRHEEKVVGVLCVEFPPDHTLTADEVEGLRIAANLCTARLYHVYQNDRWFGARWAASARKGAAALVGPKHTWAKLTALAGAVILAFLFFAKGPYRVEAPFSVETTQRQVVTAPFEGVIESVGVEVNSRVVANETVLVTLATWHLLDERAPLVAQRSEYQAQAEQAREEQDFAGIAMALSRIESLQAQIDGIDHKIAQAQLISPMSGTVVEGDLRQRIDGIVEKGDALFEVAPIAAIRAELLVPASRIGEISDDPKDPSTGHLASASHPGEYIPFTVTLIEPEAQVVDGNNVFRVRVRFDETRPWLRPGVEGVAKIDIDTRRYAWIWTRDAVNWVRMKLWL